MFVSKTVSEEIVIQWKPYSNLKKVTDIILSPAQAWTGYQFAIAWDQVRYDLQHLWGIKKRWARFNTLTLQPDTDLENKWTPKWPQLYVVEHLVSALTAAGLSDVKINFDAWHKKSFFVPIVGPGIKWIVDAIRGKTQELLTSAQDHQIAEMNIDIFSSWCPQEYTSGMFTVTIDPTVQAICYSYTENNIHRSITLSPHTGYSVCIESARQRDVVDLFEEPFTVEDVDQLDDIDLSARPMARVANFKSKIALTLLNALWVCNGITQETYFFANPWDNRSQIVSKMFPKFKAGHHEHLAHSAVSDFPWEKQALCASLWVQEMHAKITLNNTNHMFRVAVLKQIFKDKILIK